MSNGPADWLRQLAGNIRVDPAIPPGLMMLEADGGDQVARWVSHPGGPSSPELLEDVRSFTESFPYTVLVSERGEPVTCECCGTQVEQIPESLSGQRLWRPGIWESETMRRHTLRRCEWKRANP